VPLTADRKTWLDAVEIGRVIVWLHTYGERFADPQAGRPHGAPRLQPRVILSITEDPCDLPDRIDYDAASRALLIGKGRIEPVPPAVYAYEVSGMPIVRKWFNYRSTRPRGRRGSPLDDIRPDWDAETTGDLLGLLNVLGLCVALEPSQADLFDRILAGPSSTSQTSPDPACCPFPSPRGALRDDTDHQISGKRQDENNCFPDQVARR
jgi:hypothetical protein